MENKIRLTEKDVSNAYRLCDEVFIVEFLYVPQVLLAEYVNDYNKDINFHAEFCEDEGEFRYFLEIGNEINNVSKHIDYRTNWVVRALAYADEEE